MDGDSSKTTESSRDPLSRSDSPIARNEPLHDVPGFDAAIGWGMVEASPDALVLADAHGVIELVNGQTEKLFGYDRGEMLGRPVEMLLPEATARVHTAHRTGYRAAPEVRTMGSGLDLLARRSDGGEFPVEVSLSPLEVDGSLHIIAAVRDISDRVEREAERKRSEARFRAAFDNGPIAMTLTEVSPTADRVIVQANQAMADLLGYSIDELVGQQVTAFGHPDDREADDEATDAQTGGAEEDFHARKRYIHKDGRVIWVQLYVQLLSRRDDTITTIGMSVDITGEIKQRRLRSQNQAALDALSEMRSALLGELPVKGVLEQLCTRTRDFVDAEVVLFVQPDSGRELLHVLTHSAPDTHDEPQSFEIGSAFRNALDGEVWVSVGDQGDPLAGRSQVGPTMIVPVGEPTSGGGLLVIGRTPEQGRFDDQAMALMTQFAATASASLELDQARRANQRNELIEDRERIGRDMHDKVIGRLFASGMALQAAVGLVVDENARKRLLGAIDEIDDSIKEIRNAIYGLRSRVEWGKGARGEVLALAVAQSDRLGFEPNVVLSGPIDDLPTNVLDDMLATTREALVNAAKYAQAKRVSIDVSADTRQLRLLVQDDGVGFVLAEAQRQSTTGNGLGNMVVRAEQLGGHASITSAPGEGTTLEWVVPL